MTYKQHPTTSGLSHDYYNAHIGRARFLRAEALASLRRATMNVLSLFVQRNLVQPLRQWNNRRTQYAELMALSDHTLKDIGISRSDIPAIAAGVWEEDDATQKTLISAPVVRMEAQSPATHHAEETRLAA